MSKQNSQKQRIDGWLSEGKEVGERAKLVKGKTRITVVITAYTKIKLLCCTPGN